MSLLLEQTFAAETSPWGAPASRYLMMVGGEAVGHLSFRPGDDPFIVTYAGHVGYGVKPEHRGHGYAAEACRLIRPIAKAAGLGALKIGCNPDNWASIRTIERAGGVYVGTVELPPGNRYYDRGERLKRMYRLDI
jgi:predicted acetyltransferase